MITSISLHNFKCYQERADFPLSKINLLTGINGKGKSSFLQSLLLFRQSVEHNPNTESLLLNGSCVKLGTFQNVKNAFNPNSMPVYFLFKIHDTTYNFDLTCYYNFTENDKDERSLILQHFRIDASGKFIMKDSNNQSKSTWHTIDRQEDGTYTHEESFFFMQPYITQIKPPYGEPRYDLTQFLSFQQIHYVSADRLGPQEFYLKNNIGDFIHTGKQGEYVADVLSFYKKNSIIINETIKISKNSDLLSQLGEWISYILDTPNISVELNKDNTSEKENPYTNTLTFRIGTNSYTPPNVGFGYSYILPIIVSGLIAKENEILIIENPEAHLHPRAQSRLATFLAKVASMGVQVFIESHSEHILNGIRVATLMPDIELSNEEVSVLYFQDKENQPFVLLPIEKDGSIKNWVDGFFDQQEIDLSELFRLNRTKK